MREVLTRGERVGQGLNQRTGPSESGPFSDVRAELEVTESVLVGCTSPGMLKHVERAVFRTVPGDGFPSPGVMPREDVPLSVVTNWPKSAPQNVRLELVAVVGVRQERLEDRRSRPACFCGIVVDDDRGAVPDVLQDPRERIAREPKLLEALLQSRKGRLGRLFRFLARVP